LLPPHVLFCIKHLDRMQYKHITGLHLLLTLPVIVQ
jgi:hypothetical protein